MNPRVVSLAPTGIFSEDCLNLNIWRPVGRRTELKAVMVWFHGGAFIAGSSNMYDGAQMATEGDIVTVTVNYRLGVLGFVNLGDVNNGSEVPSNLGIRDLIASLEWIRENIAEFGGDPGRVTISGQSAGAVLTSLLLLSHQARGLFHGAIVQSGGIGFTNDQDLSVEDARLYYNNAGRDALTLDGLRRMDIRKLLRIQAEAQRAIRPRLPALPWFDGDVVPATRVAASGHDAARVPLMAGVTREEVKSFTAVKVPALRVIPTTRGETESVVRAQLNSERSDTILRSYSRNRDGDSSLASDVTFVVTNRNLAYRHSYIAPTWTYRFDYRHPLVGAGHATELGFLWPHPNRAVRIALCGGASTGLRKEMGLRMRAFWSNFVRYGNPGVEWSPYSPNTRAVRSISFIDTMHEESQHDRTAAWGKLDPFPYATE